MSMVDLLNADCWARAFEAADRSSTSIVNICVVSRTRLSRMLSPCNGVVAANSLFADARAPCVEDVFIIFFGYFEFGVRLQLGHNRYPHCETREICCGRSQRHRI